MYHTAPSPHHGQHPHPSPHQGHQGHHPHPQPAPPSHSNFLKIHHYSPSSILGGPSVGELVVACRLFPQPTTPQTSNIIRLCFGSYPLATRVARNLQPPPIHQPMEPGQELLLRCDIPTWDELVDRGCAGQPGQESSRVYLFCEVLRPNQVPGQAEHVLQRVWFGDFDYSGSVGGWGPEANRMPPPNQPRRQPNYAHPAHVTQSNKRAGSPLPSPRRQSPQFYHRQPAGYEYDPPTAYDHGPADYGYSDQGGSEYDRGFEVQVEGGYYHPDGGHPSHPPPPPARHLHPAQSHVSHQPSAPPHMITPTTPIFSHHPPSPSSMHTPTRQTYAHPPLNAKASPSIMKGPPPPVRTNLPVPGQLPQAPGTLVRNLQPKSPKGPPKAKQPKASAGGAGSGAANAGEGEGTTTVVTQTANGLSTTTTMKAKLELHGNLEAMALGWSRPEFENRRRLVQFWRKQVGATIEVAYKPVDQLEWQKDTIVISCIWRLEKNECYVTSVDTIYLLEAIIGNRFTVEEKNRIRRNLEGLKPDTISKNKDDTKDFFEIIMGFPDPKPRHIEKDVKVFKWEKLAEALTKIISKYSVAYNGPAPVAPAPNPIPGPLRAAPLSEEGSSTMGTTPMGTIPLPPTLPHPPPPSPAAVARRPSVPKNHQQSSPQVTTTPSSYPSSDYSQPPPTSEYALPPPPPPPPSSGAYAPIPSNSQSYPPLPPPGTSPAPATISERSELRRPASEPPAGGGAVGLSTDVQPSPYSTLSYDGIATSTPEALAETSLLPGHELGGIAFDISDSFDFGALESAPEDTYADFEGLAHSHVL